MPSNPIDHAGLEPLPFDVCLELLASVPLGRVGFYADGEVVVLPVNHAVDGQDVVFCTARGSKLAAAEDQGLVAFEADDYDQQTRSGWSVVMTGQATVVYEDAEIRHLSGLGLHPWATSVEHPFWVRIRPTSVTGRRTAGTSG
jgi:nitroimidazol reductase NimA-like FMN-containing flavoprotein (pyridoxamine 5'-phosphate oxidase superfamily)